MYLRQQLLHPVVLLIVAMAAWLSASAAAAQDEYRLQRGDRIAVSIQSFPELADESVVDLDGSVTVPGAGRLPIEGRTVLEVQEDIAALIAGRPFRVITSDTEEIWLDVHPSEIMVEVVQYGPVHVTGDIREPGTVAYLPGMTARQLVAEAGGVRRADLDPEEADRLTLELEAARTVAQRRLELSDVVVARLTGELATVGAGDGAPAAEGGEAAPALGDLEQEIVGTNEAWRQEETRSLEEQLGQMRSRLEILEERQSEESALVDLDREEAERIQGLAEQGLTPTNSRVEAERALRLSSASFLDTASEVALLQTEITRLEAELSQVPARDRRQLLSDLSQAQSQAQIAEAELQAIDQRLADLGATPGRDEDKGTVTLVLHRAGADEGGAPRMVDYDEPLLPGDVVEVVAMTAPSGD